MQPDYPEYEGDWPEDPQANMEASELIEFLDMLVPALKRLTLIAPPPPIHSVGSLIGLSILAGQCVKSDKREWFRERLELLTEILNG